VDEEEAERKGRGLKAKAAPEKHLSSDARLTKDSLPFGRD
jgi:hypothetical protein